MLPQLKDFNWYIDMKLIPGADGQRIQQPSCVLSLDVRRKKKEFFFINQIFSYR
jgi:predicted DNA-binding helix-hairpin-helix protein